MTIFQAETKTGNVVPKKINQMPDNSARSKLWTAVTDCWQLWQRLQQLSLKLSTALTAVIICWQLLQLLTALIAVISFDSCYMSFCQL